MTTETEALEFDVVIVGAGPAGIACAIRLAQLNPALTIGIIEKGSTVGAHILSGAVLNPYSLNELLPHWSERNAALLTPVTEDRFLWLTKRHAIPMPVPPAMRNHGNYIISLGQLCRWLATEAENLGINIFTGFSAKEFIFDHDRIIGIITGPKGIDKQGVPTARHQAGIRLYAKQTILAEGCRGSLTQRLFEHYALRKDCDPQTYALGIKELWRIKPEQHRAGMVIHTMGWPLTNQTYGGSFIYHLAPDLVALGLVVGLDYRNPYLDPYAELQRFKLHPFVRPLLSGGQRLSYGARALNEGGAQSLPKLTFPGGMIIGCAAGFLNVAQLKGIHNAIKSGMLAAESMLPTLNEPKPPECFAYSQRIKESKLWQELLRVRNIRPAFRWGLWPGLAYAAIDTYLLRGKAPWTFKNHADHRQLNPAQQCRKPDYPTPDQTLTFDRMSSVFLTHSYHEENQPCHLQLKDLNVPITVNYQIYAAPEQRYCPAGVYEILFDQAKQPRLHIHASNCIHCKACDIKDPTQNIVWTTPEGGCGPQYEMM